MYIAGGALLPQSSPAAIGYSRHVFRATTPISTPFWRIHENRSQSLKLMASISTEAEKPNLGSGKRYRGTRHNVGFELVAFIAEAEGIAMSCVTFKSCFGKEAEVGVAFAVPLHQSPEQVLVILDDMDLPFGKSRLLPKGGHARHNGMRSIMSHFKGSQDFPRLRIGLRERWILRILLSAPFDREETEELDFTFQNDLKADRILEQENFNKAATFVNSSTKALEKL